MTDPTDIALVPTRSAIRTTDDPVAVVQDWLVANGVDEMVPSNPVFEVAGGVLRYTSFVWADGKPSHSMKDLAFGVGGAEVFVMREVTLQTAPTDELRAAIEGSPTPITLIEHEPTTIRITQTRPAYDSRPETLAHSLRVGALMGEAIRELVDRSVRHDLSKTEPPELAVFNKYTPMLRNTTYGTPLYKAQLAAMLHKAQLAAMGHGLDHRYENNRHHPEHFADGIAGMTLRPESSSFRAGRMSRPVHS